MVTVNMVWRILSVVRGYCRWSQGIVGGYCRWSEDFVGGHRVLSVVIVGGYCRWSGVIVGGYCRWVLSVRTDSDLVGCAEGEGTPRDSQADGPCLTPWTRGRSADPDRPHCCSPPTGGC
jgi:hypothetical protein